MFVIAKPAVRFRTPRFNRRPFQESRLDDTAVERMRNKHVSAFPFVRSVQYPTNKAPTLIERSIFQFANEPLQDRKSLTTQTLLILGTKICVVGPVRERASLDCNVPEGLKILLAPMKHSHNERDKRSDGRAPT